MRAGEPAPVNIYRKEFGNVSIGWPNVRGRSDWDLSQPGSQPYKATRLSIFVNPFAPLDVSGVSWE
jgi:hypothetical protein